MNSKSLLIGIATASVTGLCVAGGEIESFWIPLGGDFEDPANWTGPVPDETVTAIFDVPEKLGPFIFFNADHVANRAVIRSGAVEFVMWDQIKGGEAVSRHFEVMDPSFQRPSLIVAENPGETATLKISEGFLTTRSLVLGVGAGSYGALEFGVGLFDLTAGLECEFQLHVGEAGQGLLTIDSGVIVTTDEAVLGAGAGSMGEIVLTDAGSMLDAIGPLTVGRQGAAVLTVSEQADLVSADGIIGQQTAASGEVTIAGQGATWTTDGSLDVGFQGTGSLSITGGAAVFTGGFATIGSFPEPVIPTTTGGMGAVTVDGPASLWLVEDALYVGLLWQGTLDVTGGALVTSQSGFVGLDTEQGPVATVQGIGSVWSNVESVSVGETGVLRVTDGGLLIADLVDVLDGAELSGDGTILADVDSAGRIRPGGGGGLVKLGPIVIEGDLTLAGGVLDIELAGTGPGDFDAVSVVGGNALLDGALEVTDFGIRQPGDSFEIVTADAVFGEFSSVSLPPLDPTLIWNLDYQPNAVVLKVTTNGDFNGDDIVGIDDFLIVLANWGPCPDPCPPCPGDADGDCIVGITDLLVVLGNWTFF